MFVISISLVAAYVTLAPGCSGAVVKCDGAQDCPALARCFKDECARCLCRHGTREVDFFSGGKIAKVCLQSSSHGGLVGSSCADGRSCPPGSICDPLTLTCTCQPSLVPNEDLSHCRLALFGDECDGVHGCNGALGYACSNGTCACAESHHRPSKWAEFVLKRWPYATVNAVHQECVARAVGEECSSDEQCAAVAGGGAVCGDCGVCECAQEDHVPDILGTKCGPPLDFGDSCTVQGDRVCDGLTGLQCGDMCDLYDFNIGRMQCSCSQMHHRKNGRCMLNSVNSSCVTDWDCFPIEGGFGYCHNGRCTMDSGYSSHLPQLPSRKCHQSENFRDKITDIISIPSKDNPDDTETEDDEREIIQNDQINYTYYRIGELASVGVGVRNNLNTFVLVCVIYIVPYFL